MATTPARPKTHNFKDLTGRKFGRLTVVCYGGTDGRRTHWLCVCDCGIQRETVGERLVAGTTTSCGCLHRQQLSIRNLTHGGSSNVKTYRTWRQMRRRCNNPRSLDYRYYGGRGISVCLRWSDFALFHQDMGDPPSADSTLERVDNNGNYEPENCIWATRAAQSRNMRRNRRFDFHGRSRCVADWEKALDFPKGTIHNRLRLGWPVARILTEPLRPQAKKPSRKRI